MKFSEGTIIEGILSKDRRAFEIMYETYFGKVYNYSLLQLGERHRAEGVTEEIFVEVIRTLDQCYGSSTLSKWIFRVARKCINRAKGQRKVQLGHFEWNRGENAADFFRLEESLLKHGHPKAICGG